MANPTYIEDYQIFPFPPLLGMKEFLNTFTDILKAKDGSEQRICFGPVPRQVFRYRVFLNSDVTQARLEAMLFGWQKLYWAIPMWQEKTVHTTTISAGASAITFNTAYADYRADTLAIIWKSQTEYETVLISTVNAGSLGLSENVVSTYTGNKVIMPCRLAQLVNPINTLQVEKEQSFRDVYFEVVDNTLLETHSAVATYGGVEVIEIPGLLDEGEERIISGDLSLQDYFTGKFKYFSDSNYNIITRQYTRQFETKEECWNFRLWLHSLYGRQNAIWIPTFRNDLQLASTIEAADVEVQVSDIDLTANMGLNDLRTHLTFILTDGTMYHREILGISQNSGGYDVVTIDSALGEEVASCDISFLDKCRRESDEIEIDWEFGNTCKSKIGFVVVTA